MKIIRDGTRAVEFSKLRVGDCFYPTGNSDVLYMKMPSFYEQSIGPINAVNLEVMGYTTIDDEHHVFPVRAEIHAEY